MSAKYTRAPVLALPKAEDGFTQTTLHERLARKQKENAQAP